MAIFHYLSNHSTGVMAIAAAVTVVFAFLTVIITLSMWRDQRRVAKNARLLDLARLVATAGEDLIDSRKWSAISQAWLKTVLTATETPGLHSCRELTEAIPRDPPPVKFRDTSDTDKPDATINELTIKALDEINDVF